MVGSERISSPKQLRGKSDVTDIMWRCRCSCRWRRIIKCFYVDALSYVLLQRRRRERCRTNGDVFPKTYQDKDTASCCLRTWLCCEGRTTNQFSDWRRRTLLEVAPPMVELPVVCIFMHVYIYIYKRMARWCSASTERWVAPSATVAVRKASQQLANGRRHRNLALYHRGCPLPVVFHRWSDTKPTVFSRSPTVLRVVHPHRWLERARLTID